MNHVNEEQIQPLLDNKDWDKYYLLNKNKLQLDFDQQQQLNDYHPNNQKRKFRYNENF